MGSRTAQERDETRSEPKTTNRRPVMLAKLVTSAVVLLTLAAPAHADPDWRAVAQALGKSGAEMPGGVYRVGLPRSDLKVTLDGVAIKPALALGSWLAFKALGEKDAMVMGDLVLTQDEVNPVITKLVANGLEITALHNHLLRSEPATIYMHVSGHGDAAKLAGALRAALQESKTHRQLAAAERCTGAGRHRSEHGRDRPGARAQGQGERRGVSGQHSASRDAARSQHGGAREHGL